MSSSELMWGYQSNFQIEAQVAAESIFRLLDARFNPRVFLLGVLVEGQSEKGSVCIEPEDCGYKTELFSGVKETARYMAVQDEDKLITQSRSIAQQRNIGQLKLKALKVAVEQIIVSDDEKRGVVSFCSAPSLVEGHHVILVLQLNRDVFNSHYSLLKNKRGSMVLKTSLLDATIGEYLELCREALSNPNPGSDFRIIDRDPSEIVRTAGKTLMFVPAYEGHEFIGLHGLFEACNTISSLSYEGAESLGTMIIARRNHPSVEINLALLEPVLMRDYRAVRKLLAVSSKDLSLLSDSGYIYGLGRLGGNYDKKAEDLFQINFISDYNWELSHAGNAMMQVVYGQPELPRLRIDKTKYEKEIKRKFPKITTAETAKLWDLVLEATKQKHGTMVVVSQGAREESQRLRFQATTVKPVSLTPEMIKMVTSIDGAVLVDQRAVCYAIGVILDGLASRKGTPSRGARYNSAIKYVESSEYPCMAIVVSEDGAIDLVTA